MTKPARSFWTPEPLAPIQFLAGLRDAVLAHSQTRLPKWRFRLAPDLAVQIQPKPAERRDRFFLFDCLALQGDGINLAAFQSSKGLNLFCLWFGIIADGDGWATGPYRARRPGSSEQLDEFSARVVAELGSGRFDRLEPGMMFSGACLICGRELTDPASMARWIGPECFGSTSLVVPRTLLLKPQTVTAAEKRIPLLPEGHAALRQADLFAGGGPVTAGPLRRVIEAARSINGGCSLKSFTVLAELNDPYRLDTPANHLVGAWVAEQLARTGRERIHLRGLHYAIVVRGDVRKPNGEVYVNDDANWQWLQTVAKAARWLVYVPFAAIIDERNAAPVIHRRPHVESETWLSIGLTVEIPDAADLQPHPGCSIFARQPYSLVIVGEKSSLGEVVLPIARQFQADLYLPTGEISDTLIHQIAADAVADGRPLRLFYLSDFDPAGYEMPANVGRKLQALRDLLFPELDFECRAIALTDEQVRELNLPSTPLKETERRSDRWRAAWGVEQTEIDALATLQPQVLRRIVRKELEPFFDDTLIDREDDAKQEWIAEAEAALERQIDQNKLDQLRAQAEGKLDELRDQIDELNRCLRLVAGDDIKLPEVEVPEAIIDPDTHPLPLVSSAWDWVEQTRALIARKLYDNGEAGR